ncbi:hypothetical protein DFH09DRAFT_1318664 [Mycena vulgaris]|nr:hypothetical protein DFH09DRAFT_1318664 [Mycena vulgaris]
MRRHHNASVKDELSASILRSLLSRASFQTKRSMRATLKLNNASTNGPRNLDATCVQARQRMQRLRAQPRSPEEVQQVLKKRREADATDNELYRRRKSVAKHRHDNFMDYYFPKYAELGQKYLP